MSILNYFEQRANDRSWGLLYEGALNVRTYNFITRRAAVARLLEPEEVFPRVLDVGCGTGDYAPLAWQHQGTYHGMDFSLAMARQAHERLNGGGRRLLVVGSGEAIPYHDDSFDLVLAIGYIEYFRDPMMAIQEIHRVLRPGGVLVMQSYKRELFSNLSRIAGAPRALWRRLATACGAGQGGGIDVDAPYSQRRLDRLLAAWGFRRTGWVFNNFHVLPASLRVKFPSLYIRLSEAMGRSRSRWWSLLAVNYIGRYVLERPRRAAETADGALVGSGRVQQVAQP